MNFNRMNFNRQLCQICIGLGAASSLLAAQVAMAQSGPAPGEPRPAGAGDSQAGAAEQIEFSEADQNGDKRVGWNELRQQYGQYLAQNNWDRQQVLASFDQNQDNELNEQEYEIFVVALEAREQGASPQQGQNQVAGRESQRKEAAVGSAQTNGQNQGQSRDDPGQQNQATATEQEDSAIYAPESQMISLADGERMSLDELKGSEITNRGGETLGTVEDVVRSQEGEQTALVVGIGGFFGFGSKDVVISTDEVVTQDDRLVVQTGADDASLEDRPEYQQQDYVSVR